jgi:hypothetical protein
MSERKLIQLFKLFVEKAFAPQLRKLGGDLTEWNKFSNMLSQ